MTDHFLLGLLLKMATSALIVVSASLIVERSGPFLGAMIATLPISAGPAYAFLAYEHGAGFVERSSLVSLSVNPATAVFIVVYAVLAQRHGVLASVAGALGAWVAAAWTLTALGLSLPAALVVNAAVYAGAVVAARRFLAARSPVTAGPKPWWAVPARAAGIMTLVAVVVLAGRLVGPSAAGLAALAPVVLTSLAVVLHPRIGGPAAAAVLANGLPGMVGFTISIIVLHLTVAGLGATAALLLALAVCVAWNLSLMARERRRAVVAG